LVRVLTMTKADDKSREPEKSEDSIPTASTPSSVVGPGTQIDHFRVDHELGRGGAGVVYLAHDTRLGRKVAIKMLPPEIVNNPEILHRWKREARLLVVS
jgi:serine/threonine protein kinase